MPGWISEMGLQRKKTRVTSKINQLPAELRQSLDQQLLDTSRTYTEISEWLKEQGYDVSRSAVGRYALRSNRAAQRLLEAQKQTETLLTMVQRNPDADYTEAGLQLLMDGLVNRLATAEEEFDSMPLGQVGKLITALSRTKDYKDKVRQDMQSQLDQAFTGMEAEIMQAIKDDPDLAQDMASILTKAKAKMAQP